MSKATFLLFISGENTTRSKSAINNIKRRLKTENYNLMIIDILENPQVAELVGIVATPLLMRTIPKPVRRFVGDFTDSKLDILT